MTSLADIANVFSQSLGSAPAAAATAAAAAAAAAAQGSAAQVSAPLNRGLIDSILYAQSQYNLERIRDNTTRFIEDFGSSTDPRVILLREGNATGLDGYKPLKTDIEAFQLKMASMNQKDIDAAILGYSATANGNFTVREQNLDKRKRELIQNDSSVLSTALAGARFWFIDICLYWLAPIMSLWLCVCYLNESPVSHTKLLRTGNYVIMGFWSVILYPITHIKNLYSSPKSLNPFKMGGVESGAPLQGGSLYDDDDDDDDDLSKTRAGGETIFDKIKKVGYIKVFNKGLSVFFLITLISQIIERNTGIYK